MQLCEITMQKVGKLVQFKANYLQKHFKKTHTKNSPSKTYLPFNKTRTQITIAASGGVLAIIL